MESEWHKMNHDEVFSQLETSRWGLSSTEAERRLTVYGKNELEKPPGTSLIGLFLDQFKDFLIIILIVAALISALFGLLDQGQDHFIDSLAISAIVILNGVLGFYQEYKAEKAIEALEDMQQEFCKVFRDKRQRIIPTTELVPGDIIILEAGDKVPADSRLFKVYSLKVEEAVLTGESSTVRKDKHKIVMDGDVILADRSNVVFMGTTVNSGRAQAIVCNTGMKTEFGKIAKMLTTVESEKTPLTQKMESFGHQLGIAILVICAIVFIYGSFAFRDANPFEMFILGVSLAVAAIPEGLPTVMTLTLAMGIRKMIRVNALMRKLTAVETLGSTTIICSDKTGTLTHNQMTAREISVEGREVAVTGEGFLLEGEFLQNGERIEVSSIQTMTKLMECSCLCSTSEINNGENGNSNLIGDPTELALMIAAKKAGFSKEILLEKYPLEFMFAFESKRKSMATIHQMGDKRIIFVKGAPVKILNGSSSFLTDEGGIEPLDEKTKERITIANKNMARRALRVLACAYKIISPEEAQAIRENEDAIHCESDLIYIGLVGMIDPPRAETKPSIAICKRAGIRVMMITGDHKLTAQAIAQEIGLVEPNEDIDSVTVTGNELQAFSDEELVKKVQYIQIFARANPEDKLRIVDALKTNNEIVVMTGDGVNDAPALKRADVGVAMGITGTAVSKESSKMILTDDNFASIVKAIEEGRAIYDNMKKFITYLLSCNAGEVLVVFLGMLFGLPLPLIALQLLWVNLVTDALPALALGVVEPEPNIMDRKPRNTNEPILNLDTISNIAVSGIWIAFFVLLLFWEELIIHGLPMDIGLHDTRLALPRTMAFCTLIVFQLFHALNNSSQGSILNRRLFTNTWLFIAIGSSFVLQLILIYSPLGQIFKVTPINLIEFITIIVLGVSIIFVDEIRKLILHSVLPRIDSQENAINSAK